MLRPVLCDIWSLLHRIRTGWDVGSQRWSPLCFFLSLTWTWEMIISLWWPPQFQLIKTHQKSSNHYRRKYILIASKVQLIHFPLSVHSGMNLFRCFRWLGHSTVFHFLVFFCNACLCVLRVTLLDWFAYVTFGGYQLQLHRCAQSERINGSGPNENRNPLQDGFEINQLTGSLLLWCRVRQIETRVGSSHSVASIIHRPFHSASKVSRFVWKYAF